MAVQSATTPLGVNATGLPAGAYLAAALEREQTRSRIESALARLIEQLEGSAAPAPATTCSILEAAHA